MKVSHGRLGGGGLVATALASALLTSSCRIWPFRLGMIFYRESCLGSALLL